MIVTLTPNPSLDRTLQVPALHRGALHRATDSQVDPGGKGVNVSRALAAHGLATVAVLPLGGPDGDRLAALLDGLGIGVSALPVAGGVRSNITLAEPDGTTTKLNEPGPRLSGAEQRALLDAVLALAAPQTWVVGSGSLPPGVPDTFYLDLVAGVQAIGARVVVDTSGPALTALLAGGATGGAARPDLLKPNREELAEAVGRRLRTLGDVVDAARDLQRRGIATVLASLGADGAVLVDADGAVHGEARIEAPVSTVGAGDALLAGYLAAAAAGAPPRDCLATALRWGGAATALPGSRMPAPDDVAAIAVTIHAAIDSSRLLEGEHR